MSGHTKFLKFGGKSVVSSLLNPVQFTGLDGSFFRTNATFYHNNSRMTRTIYQVNCGNCDLDPVVNRVEVYLATCGFSNHKKQMEHTAAIRNKIRCNVLSKHHV